ncbi:hypothetical protein [Agromyces arachidis]|uniref:hypothetical protein n=1 Tax=Agromyces arachidis TaxID=766966 RepID=UPI004056D5CE
MLLILLVLVGMVIRRRTANVGGALEAAGIALYSLFVLLTSTAVTLWFRYAATPEEQRIPKPP